MKVRLFKAEFCLACKEALKRLKELQSKYNFDLEIYEFTENRELFKELGIKFVPLILIDSKPISLKDLETLLEHKRLSGEL